MTTAFPRPDGGRPLLDPLGDPVAMHREQRAGWHRRHQLERQLHDGASLRISALSLRIGLLRYQEPDDERTWRDRVGELQEELHAVLQELRDVANKIYPPLLDEAGLAPALRELAGQSGLRVEIDTDGERYGVAAEGAAYFGVAGCLALRPPGAPTLHLDARRDGPDLVLRIRGLAAGHADVMLDQVRPLGGRLDADQGGPANISDSIPDTGPITVRIPCE